MRFEELAVGQRAELARVVSGDDVARFAEISGDTNPVHLDDAAAAASRFGARIAHGVLSAGLISAVLGTRLPGPGSIYLSQSLRFARPVYLDDTVTASVEVVELIAAKRRVRLATRCTNQHGDTVLDGEAMVWCPEDGA